jgi:hypothetical protein
MATWPGTVSFARTTRSPDCELLFRLLDKFLAADLEEFGLRHLPAVVEFLFRRAAISPLARPSRALYRWESDAIERLSPSRGPCERMEFLHRSAQSRRCHGGRSLRDEVLVVWVGDDLIGCRRVRLAAEVHHVIELGFAGGEFSVAAGEDVELCHRWRCRTASLKRSQDGRDRWRCRAGAAHLHVHLETGVLA